MRIFIFFVFYCFALTASAQDLTGIWRGHFISSNRIVQLLGEQERYKFEVQVNQNNKAFDGVTYSYKTTEFYGKASCYGTLNKQTKKVLLEELKLLELKTTRGVTACIMTCFLQYSKMDNEEFLEGTYTSMSTADSSNCGKGTVFLRKVTTSDFHKEPFLAKKEKIKPPVIRKTVPAPGTASKTPPAKPSPSVTKKPPVKPPSKPTAKTKTPPPLTPRPNDNLKVVTDDSLKHIPSTPLPKLMIPRVLSSRKNELVQTITTSANEVSINIYDNGTVDNDTVSVYLDKKLVISKQRLTEKPIAVKFSLNDKTAQHEFVMVAENLGEIPPNTSLMVVTAGTQQYEVRITSNEQKNAVVVFKYQPE